MIKTFDLRLDSPQIIDVDGYYNSVLALVKPIFYTEENTYIPAWQVVNTVYYNKNPELYQGWIELEHILPPKNLR